jgi:hypothetical protein
MIDTLVLTLNRSAVIPFSAYLRSVWWLMHDELTRFIAEIWEHNFCTRLYKLGGRSLYLAFCGQHDFILREWLISPQVRDRDCHYLFRAEGVKKPIFSEALRDLRKVLCACTCVHNYLITAGLPDEQELRESTVPVLI